MPALYKLLIPAILFMLPLTSYGPKANAANQAWQLLCDQEKSNCRAFAQIIMGENTIASTMVLKNLKLEDNTKTTVAIIMLPLGFHIPSGIEVTIDNKITFKANLLECKSKGCRAIFPLDENIISALKKGHEISFHLIDSDSRKSLELSYSLAGFSKTYRAMQISSN